jgi:glucokinase
MLLVGDLGGTKLNLAIISEEAGIRKPLVEATLPSGDYSTFEALLEAFLRRVTCTVDRAVFGVAGPVLDGRADVTNLDFDVDEEQVRGALGIKTVRLLNDLAAVAHGIPLLSPEELVTLNEGTRLPGGALAVVAPGTGLGEAYLTWDTGRYRPQPSEGGHATFAPIDLQQTDMVRFLLDRYEHVSVERVCSGSGIPNIYAFLKETGFADEPDWLSAQLAAADDPTPVIIRTALSGESALSEETLRIFVSILGAEAGNLALKVMATGGVYLAGGIPPRILPALTPDPLITSFVGKGRMSVLLAQMPLHVVLNPKTALLGAARYGLDLPNE